MSRLLCCLCERRADMGAALSHPQEGEACDGAVVAAAPPTMADVIRERKKKAAGSGLGTLRRRIALVRRPRDNRPDRGCEHARFIRSVVSSWRLVEVFLLCEELEAGAALRDLVTQAELAREPAGALHADLARAYRDRWWCDVELVGSGWSVPAHRAILSARCTYFRDLLQRYPPSCCRVPLEGAGAALSREELEAGVLALYAGPSACSRRPLCGLCAKWDRGVNVDDDLDIINVDNNGTLGACGCGRARPAAGALRRLGALLGFCVDSLQHDMRYLLDSGEMADARLVFRLEGGCGAAYGFRTALELPCHRLVLAARSRFFRSVMSRRSSSAGGGGGAGPGGGGGAAAWCVDEKVLPRRFARALLHAAYTDTVDLGLIGRNSTSPLSTNSTGTGTTAWSGVTRSGSRPVTAAMLDDAFQLYEIARFLEMPIVVQGCEDAVVEALTPDSLPHVLRWAAQPHASHWVHRQAMRYLRDEFPTIMSASACGRIPSSALSEALGSPFLQASEPQALRALLRWAQAARPDLPAREPSAVWARAQSVGRRAGRAGRGGRGGRRRDAGDAALRDALAPLAPLLRLEHLPPDHDLLHQVVRRGIVPAAGGAGGEGAGGPAAWLARGAYRPPRCFLPYLDEIKALLEEQAVPEAELARARRDRYLHRIPDTLYMVAAARNGGRSSRACSAESDAGGAGGMGRAARARAPACRRARWRRCGRARGCCARPPPPPARWRCTPPTGSPSTSRSRCGRCARCRCRTPAPSCCWPTWTTTGREMAKIGNLRASGTDSGSRPTPTASCGPTSTPQGTAAGRWAAARCAVRRARCTCRSTTPGRARAGASRAGRPTWRDTGCRCRSVRRAGRACRACRPARSEPAARARAGCRPPCRTWPWRPTPTRTCSPPGTTSDTRRPGSTAAAACCSWTWVTEPRTRPDPGPARSEPAPRTPASSATTHLASRACAAAPTTTSCAPPSSSPSSERTRRPAAGRCCRGRAAGRGLPAGRPPGRPRRRARPRCRTRRAPPPATCSRPRTSRTAAAASPPRVPELPPLPAAPRAASPGRPPRQPARRRAALPARRAPRLQAGAVVLRRQLQQPPHVRVRSRPAAAGARPPRRLLAPPGLPEPGRQPPAGRPTPRTLCDCTVRPYYDVQCASVPPPLPVPFSPPPTL